MPSLRDWELCNIGIENYATSKLAWRADDVVKKYDLLAGFQFFPAGEAIAQFVLQLL